jgi:excisionase family DNA binding protein
MCNIERNTVRAGHVHPPNRMITHEAPRYEGQRSELLDEPAARAVLGGISRPTLSRIRQRGEIAEVRIGRRVFFRLDDLDEYIERNREAVSVS